MLVSLFMGLELKNRKKFEGASIAWPACSGALQFGERGDAAAAILWRHIALLRDYRRRTLATDLTPARKPEGHCDALRGQ